MDIWQQLLAVALGVMVLFIAVPSIKGAMQRSKEADEKHWGTAILLAAVLIGFVIFLISSVRQ